MGLLTLGEPLSWSETKQYAEHVRKHGIKQFLHIFKARKYRTDEFLKWGDEIEYILVKFDHKSQKVRVSCRAEPILHALQAPEEAGQTTSSLWRPEFGAYMVEGTPGLPYGGDCCELERFLINESKNLENSGVDQPAQLANGMTSSSEIELNASTSSKLEQTFNCDEVSQSTSSMFAFLNSVESNMKLRRNEVQQLLEPDEAVLTISSFPLLGTRDFCSPPFYCHPTHGFAQSLFFPDEAIFQGHPRFRTLVNNIRERRGSNVAIQIPIFRDINTPNPFIESLSESLNIDPDAVLCQQSGSQLLDTYRNIAEQRRSSVPIKPDHIYMDAMGFGMGCCCLQVTFQASNICEARILYDHLTPLCPILMALSAASPVFRGLLSDLDCRWSVIAASVDDRTDAEMSGTNPAPESDARKRSIAQIPKSRFDSVDLYIYPGNEHYNDIPVCYDQGYFRELIEAGVDDLLAKHIAHLFVRDPLVLFREKINIDDQAESDHFENIQSTNWQTMRFKPPPPNSPQIGWRVEFRPMEVQLTDTENAAFVIFVVLITRLILSFNLNLLIPMSKVEENMKEAQKRNAASEGRFWFRSDITLPQNVVNHFARSKPDCDVTNRLSHQLSPSNRKSTPSESDSGCPEYSSNAESSSTGSSIYSSCVQMSIREIINGTSPDTVSEVEGGFPGLIPLLNFYLDSMEIDAETRCTISGYLRLIANRANGLVPTPAQIIRQFVTSHQDYRQDSRVSDRICYDLLNTLNQLQTEQISLKDFLEKIRMMQQQKQASASVD